MNRRTDFAQDHKICGVREEDMRKGVSHLSPGEGRRSLWVFGELMTHKIAGYRTGGAYALFGVTTPPGAGPPLHVQHREDESFYVLEGEYEFLVEGSTLRAEAGSLLYVRKGTLHAHKNVDGAMAKMLVNQTPGGSYERFFEKVGKPADADPGPLVIEDHADAAGIGGIAAEYGIEIPPPFAKEVGPANALRGARHGGRHASS
jgi:quercetin dioxygenase-like cupin family protein